MFFFRAEKVHGDRYDYSKVVYKNTKTKVRIICPDHGEFWQTPEKHMSGQGCPGCSQAKLEQTNLERYGARRPLQNREIRKKQEGTVEEQYGVPNALQNAEVLQRRRERNMERYGVPETVLMDSVREKREMTNRERYGGVSPFSSADVREKAKVSVLDTYGVDNPMRSEEILKRHRETCRERYQADSPLGSSEVREKILETVNERYGGNISFADPEIREKKDKTMPDRYGVLNNMHHPDTLKKVFDTKREHGTFHTSEPEERLYVRLCDCFGAEDVKRQYCSDVYPHACDFYIASRDLYIELNAAWTHGGHRFDVGCAADRDLCDCYRQRFGEKDSSYYRNMLDVWMVRDVKKRLDACMGRLNYVVFWDTKLKDADVWFAMGCPDGRDWDFMYSWIPDRMISGMECPGLSGSLKNLSLIAKACQFPEFYKREMRMWKENPEKNGIPLQVWLYANRFQYLGKRPEELTDLQIMNGFSISGVLKGYSTFDTSMMHAVVEKYGIRSVYDPCAGWGERMLYCMHHGITYEGVDVNPGLQDGYRMMTDRFGDGRQSVSCLDSAAYQPQGADAVITCPPYGDQEVYSPYGSENLSEDAFLSWWGQVVQNCSGMRYFCFQVNQRWLERMKPVVVQNGFRFLEQMDAPVKASHFQRRSGQAVRMEHESMLIFEKEDGI